MTDDDLRKRLAAIESRLSRLEQSARTLDARTVGDIRLGPNPQSQADHEKQQMEAFDRLKKQVEADLARPGVTTDPNDPRIKRGAPDAKPVPQNEAYLVLSADEIAKGFVRPYFDSYTHTVCGTVTTMSPSIAATYARDPWFYGATYCVSCAKHLLLAEFVWPDGTPMDPAQWSETQLAAVQTRLAERPNHRGK